MKIQQELWPLSTFTGLNLGEVSVSGSEAFRCYINIWSIGVHHKPNTNNDLIWKGYDL